MYFILNIQIDDKGGHHSHAITNHAHGGITHGITLLEDYAKQFIRDECGNQIAKDVKIITIKDLNQVCEPIIDTMLVYKLETEPHVLHIYQRKTKVVPGVIYGQSLLPEFKKVRILNLIHYDGITHKNVSDTTSTTQQIEMISVGPTKVPNT